MKKKFWNLQKHPSYSEKDNIKWKLKNLEGVIILYPGESPEGISAATAPLGARFSRLCIFCLHRTFDKIHRWKFFAYVS